MHLFAESNSVCRIKVLAVVAGPHDFVVGLTNDDPSTTPPVYKSYYHSQFEATFPHRATALMRFDTDDMYRYVILQVEFKSIIAFCLAEVEVYERGKTFCVPKLLLLLKIN